ncbi:MAG: hypothetical protein IPI58_06615 [Alphaproteobacteria bacterium]|nr:MAG: hypothetical protein IPI58_06615 [Alphaproteobacteria bacterium]
MNTLTSLVWDPVLPLAVMVILAVALTAGLVWAWRMLAPAARICRVLVAAALILVLANPQQRAQTRRPLPDIALVVVDDSASMALSGRIAGRDAVLAALQEKLSHAPEMEWRVVRVAGEKETRLAPVLAEALGQVPKDRLAGIMILTDGQIHDSAAELAALAPRGPVHVLMIGERDEKDRRLVLSLDPVQGVVGGQAHLRLRVEDSPKAFSREAPVTLFWPDGRVQSLSVPVGQDMDFPWPLDHAGTQSVAAQTVVVEGEVAASNNAVAGQMTAVRERMRVLLVSGVPDAGTRVWRNLMKSDPAVDLVHFTLLRRMASQDPTPPQDMALIPFPVHELFGRRLADFDLMIFDRFAALDLLPTGSLARVAQRVRSGGALLVTMGPEEGEAMELSTSPLADVLPLLARQGLGDAFHPRLTPEGRRHPVTAFLDEDPAPYGRWLRQVLTAPGPVPGHVLLQGAQDAPLLALASPGQGRVAQLTSDQVWLWARGFEGGGPYGEFMRRLVHWLLREPDLEDTRLTARRQGQELIVERRSVDPEAVEAQMIAPDGSSQTHAMTPDAKGLAQLRLPAGQDGLWQVREGTRHAWALPTLTREGSALVASAQALASLVKASGGTLRWLGRDPRLSDIAVTRVPPSFRTDGGDGLALVAHGAFVETGATSRPVLDPAAMAGLMVFFLLWAWRREARRKSEH